MTIRSFFYCLIAYHSPPAATLHRPPSPYEDAIASDSESTVGSAATARNSPPRRRIRCRWTHRRDTPPSAIDTTPPPLSRLPPNPDAILNACCFPHIIRKIINYAPDPRGFRGASREWRRYVDSIWGPRLILDGDDRCRKPGSDRRPRGNALHDGWRVPLLTDLTCVDCLSPLTRPKQCHREGLLSSCVIPTSVLAHTRVLDVRGVVRYGVLTRLIANMPRLDILRLYAHDGRNGPFTLLWNSPSDFACRHLLPVVRRVVIFSRLAEETRGRRGLRALIGSPLEEVVVHLQFLPGEQVGSVNEWSAHHPIEGDVKRVTLILTDASDPSAPQTSNNPPLTTAEQSHLREELERISTDLVQLRQRNWRVTIVGFEYFAYRRGYDGQQAAEVVDATRSIMTVLDQDTYIQSVGCETWALYTQDAECCMSGPA